MKNLYKEYFEVTKDKMLTEKVLYTRIAVSVGLIILYMFAMSYAAYAYFMTGISSDYNYIGSANFDLNINVINESTKTVTLSADPPAITEQTDVSTEENAEKGEGDPSENDSNGIALASETDNSVESAAENSSNEAAATSDEEKKTETVTEYSELTVNRIDKNNYWVNLKPGKNVITVSHSGTAETGFCIAEIDGVKHITQQVGVDRIVSGQKTPEITFTIELSENKVVYFTAHWGTSSKYNLSETTLFENADNVYDSANYILNGAVLDYIEEEEEHTEEEEEPEETPEDEPEEKSEESTETEDEPKTEDGTDTAPEEKEEEAPVAEIMEDGRIKVTLEASDSIRFIADYYGTTTERIAVYNDIKDPNKVYIGQVIIIPPEEWELPEEEPSTEEPSTEEPSTEEPSTEEPSTEEPTTEEPSTEEPSTEEPSTEEPTTEEPSTEEPSTEEPSTEEPTTEEPSTEEPSTEEPSTEEPSTEEPSTEEPSTEEPSTEEPSTEESSTEEPSTEEPSTEEPSTEEPSTEEPSTEEPSTEEPSTETTEQ